MLRIPFLRFKSVVACCAFASTGALYAQNPAVLTAEYNNGRTAANNSEVALNPTTVNPTAFGKVGTWALDGQVVGQPLYVPGVRIGKQSVNALFVGTMNNTVYALNADAPGSAPLWQVNLGPAVPLNYAGACPAYFAARSPLGILSTPVIDSDKSTIYVIAANPVLNQPTYTHTLYALDLGSGEQKHGGSITISASVPGTGTSSVNGTVSLGPTTTNLIQRPALLLSNNVVSVAFSGCGPDPSPYHGWVVGYNAGNIKQQAFAFNATPNGDEGGIWQAGRGLVSDSSGSIYFETGNGTADQGPDFGESFVKLSTAGAVQSWFTPYNVQTLSDLDLDLSTTSPLLTPDTNLLIGGGKQGLLYVLNPSAMGNGGNPVQSFIIGPGCDNLFNNAGCQVHSLAYWQNAGPSQLYVWGVNQTLQDFSYVGGQFTSTPVAQTAQTTGYPGGILTVTSAAGLPATGIVWALTPGVLHAFSATNVANELWNSNQNTARDGLAGNYHFEQYTVVAGKVFIPDTQNHVVVYGLLPH